MDTLVAPVTAVLRIRRYIPVGLLRRTEPVQGVPQTALARPDGSGWRGEGTGVRDEVPVPSRCPEDGPGQGLFPLEWGDPRASGLAVDVPRLTTEIRAEAVASSRDMVVQSVVRALPAVCAAPVAPWTWNPLLGLVAPHPPGQAPVEDGVDREVRRVDEVLPLPSLEPVRPHVGHTPNVLSSVGHTVVTPVEGRP